MTSRIYTLRLAEGKYYVGQTEKLLEERLVEHQTSPGPWLQRFAPISGERLHLVQVVSTQLAPEAESRITYQLMYSLGVNAVRGAQYCSKMDYTRADVWELSRTMGHYLKLDYKELRQKLNGELPCARCMDCGTHTEYNMPRCLSCWLKNTVCYVCGIKGHLPNQCLTAAPYASPAAHVYPLLEAVNQLMDEEAREYPTASQPSEEMLPPASQQVGCADCGSERVRPQHLRCYRCYVKLVTCIACGQTGHMYRDCDAVQELLEACRREEERGPAPPIAPARDARDTGVARPKYRTKRPRFSTPGICWTCGRGTHMAPQCTFAIDVNGKAITDED